MQHRAWRRREQQPIPQGRRQTISGSGDRPRMVAGANACVRPCLYSCVPARVRADKCVCMRERAHTCACRVRERGCTNSYVHVRLYICSCVQFCAFFVCVPECMYLCVPGCVPDLSLPPLPTAPCPVPVPFTATFLETDSGWWRELRRGSGGGGGGGSDGGGSNGSPAFV